MSAQDNLSKEATLTQLFNDEERTINQGEYAKALFCLSNFISKLLTVESMASFLSKFSEGAELLHKYRTDNGLRHLEAQVAYKLEDYNASLKIYYNLLQETDAKEDTYNDINVAKAALQFSGNKPNNKYTMADSVNTYKLAYNYACLYLGRKDFKKSRKIIDQRKKYNICRKPLTDNDYSEEVIKKELGTIYTQLAYLYQLQGRITEVIDLYQSILKFKQVKGTDITVSAIASNNFVTAKKDTELFDSAHKLKVASTNTLDYKLFRSQRRIIAMNEALLSLYIHKYKACQDVTHRLLQTYPENDDLYLILASISYQTFEKFLSLIKDDDEKYKPGYVGLLVWLYEQFNKPEKSVQALDQAGKFWKSGKKSYLMSNHKDIRSDESRSILKQTAAFKLKTSRYHEAAQDYEQFVKDDSLDIQALTGLVAEIDVESLEKFVPGVKKSYIKKADAKAM
ncbi:670_t:CDS:10 [Scutellospora calospora]|uniref:670_t:CDS:1 n=1 Tax=Scutellospora calospora TaxID=85575 RepID=A0ACA9JTW1_9GLOM|nr:670_t:CDS:10 [Scutellospora calospora]